jgi:serine/threonine protein kinase
MECPQCFLDNSPDSSFCKKCGSILASAGEGLSPSTQTFNVEIKELSIKSLFAERYRIIQKVGKGGMGIVYSAEDTKLKRIVALKLIRPEFTADREARKRFVLEAQLAASLDHPNICTVFEISQVEGQDFITMAYIEGRSLDEEIESGPVDLEKAIDVGIQVADGLNEAHEKGIVHRDIKSANIMLTRKEQAKIMDFGLAKLTEGPGVTKTTRIVGTVAYMSPEQAKGESVDSRSDIWSLGVVLYQMLTGQLPFRKDSAAGVLYCIVHETPKPVWHHHPDVPLKLGTIIDKCLEKNPAKRYQTAADLAKDLKSVKQEVLAKKKTSRISLFAFHHWKLLRNLAIPFGVVILISVFLLFVPSARLMVKNWTLSEKIGPEMTSAPPPVLPLTPESPMIKGIPESDQIANISVGANDKIEPGQTGQIYYKKQTGSEETKEIIAQFMVKEVMAQESRVEIAGRKEDIKPGYLVEFDKNPRSALFIDTDPDRAALYLDDQYKGMTDMRLILNPGRYNLRIKAKNFQEVTDTINAVPGVLVRKPYRLSPLLLQSGTLEIDSTPSRAEVYLGSEERAGGLTRFEKIVPPGRYTGKIRLEGYEDKPFDIDVKPGKIGHESYTLAAKKGTLVIESTPQDAEIFLDGGDFPVGRTPLEKELPAKEYRVLIKKDGYEESRDTIILGPAETARRNYPLTQLKRASPRPYTLYVNTVPGDALVFVNNKEEGRSPLNVSLDDPNVILKIVKDNYKPVEKFLKLTESPTIQTIQLEQVGTGTLVITADPSALIEIDGKPLKGGVPPGKTLSVQEGERTVTFVFDGYGVYEKKVSVRDGDTLPVNLKFEQWMLEKKGLYAFTALPKSLPPIILKIDGRTIGDGKVPPRKRFWVDEGEHKMTFTLSDKTTEYAEVELDDFIKARENKTINVLTEMSVLQDLKDSNLPEELSKRVENDWISIISNPSTDFEVNGSSHAGVTSLSGFPEETRKRHALKIRTKTAHVDHKIEISILKIETKRLYKVVITMGSVLRNDGTKEVNYE